MDLLFYLILIMGSYSIGYGLMRTGFPLVQKRKSIQKIATGYLGGILIFGLPFLVTTVFNLKDIYYFLACLIIFFILFLTFLLKRAILNEEDPLTKEDQLRENKFINSNNEINQTAKVNYAELVKENNTKTESPKETIVVQKPKIEPKSVTFDQGLMIKSRSRDEQVFKEENKSIIINKPKSEDQKNSIMTKLREYAQDITSTKKEDKAKNKLKEEEDDFKGDEELIDIFKDE